MSDAERKFRLVSKHGKDSRPTEEKMMLPEEAGRLNDLFQLEESVMRWLDVETGEEVHLQGMPKPGETGHSRLLNDVEVANIKILELFQQRAAQFVIGLQRMMGQAAYDVFVIWEQYRAAIHNPRIPKNLIIQEPQRPEDLPIMFEIGAILKVFIHDKMLDDCLKVAPPGADMPDIKWSGNDAGNTGNKDN